MMVTYETHPVPVVSDFAEGCDRVHQMCAGDIPAFAGSIPPDLLETQKDYEVMYEAYNEALAVEGLSFYTFARMRRMMAIDDVPLHLDRDRVDGRPFIEELNFHTTTLGSVAARFFVPSDNFWERGYSEIHKKDREHIANGCIDDELFKPVCYTADVTAPGYVAFCLAGYNPAAHQFTTVSRERRSTLMVAKAGPPIPFDAIYKSVI
jgi:hypothetical protein